MVVYIHTHTHTYIYIYVCVCVYDCMNNYLEECSTLWWGRSWFSGRQNETRLLISRCVYIRSLQGIQWYILSAVHWWKSFEETQLRGFKSMYWLLVHCIPRMFWADKTRSYTIITLIAFIRYIKLHDYIKTFIFNSLAYFSVSFKRKTVNIFYAISLTHFERSTLYGVD